MSLDAAANEFGISRSTLFRLIRGAALAKYKRRGDRKTYVSRRQLRELVEFKRVIEP